MIESFLVLRSIIYASVSIVAFNRKHYPIGALMALLAMVAFRPVYDGMWFEDFGRILIPLVSIWIGVYIIKK